MLRTMIYSLIVMMFWQVSLFANAVEITFVTEDLPPLQIDNPQGKPTGAMIELINEIIKEMHVDASIIIMPWARAFNIAQKTENTFIFSMLRSKDRESLFQWIGRIYTIRAHLASLKKNNIAINSIEEAKAYKIGVTRNALAETYLKQRGFVENKNIYVSPTYGALWNNLLNGNTDLTFTNNIIWAPQIEKAGVDPNEISLIFEIEGFASDMYLAASNTTDKELIKQARNALKSIKADGRYDSILKKWHL